MDNIERLRSEKTKLIQRLTAIDEILEQHEKLERRIAQMLATEPQDVALVKGNTPILSDQVESSSGTEPPIRVAENGSREVHGDTRRSVSTSVREFEDTVKAILLDADRPMDRRSLLQALLEKGHEVPGKDPENTLGARMSRMPGVKNVKTVKGKGYWLVSRIADLGGVSG